MCGGNCVFVRCYGVDWWVWYWEDDDGCVVVGVGC